MSERVEIEREADGWPPFSSSWSATIDAVRLMNVTNLPWTMA